MKRILIISVFVLSMLSCSENKNKIFYPNGNIHKVVTVENEKMNGPAKIYYETGELQWEGILLNDLKHGLCIQYFQNRNKQSEINYKNGKENGECKTYYENGKLKTEAVLIDNKQNGICKEYYETGLLKSEGSYLNGLTNGILKLYFPNQKLEMDALMELGKPLYFKQFNAQGIEIKEHRIIKTDTISNSINIGEVFTTKLTLTGPLDNIAIEAFGGEAKQGEEIKFMGKLPINDENGVVYTFTPKTVGAYVWRIWFDVKDNNGTAKKYTYSGRVEVESKKAI